MSDVFDGVKGVRAWDDKFTKAEKGLRREMRKGGKEYAPTARPKSDTSSSEDRNVKRVIQIKTQG